MDEAPAEVDPSREATAAFLAAGDAALESASRLHQAWRSNFQGAGPAPEAHWVAEVAELQAAYLMALERVQAINAAVRALAQEKPSPHTEAAVAEGARTRKRRRKQNRLFAKLGKPGQRLLRFVLLALLLLSILVATGAGISIALDVAGWMRLIEDPVQLPLASQLAIFAGAVAAAWILRRLLKELEDALYGRKGLRPKGLQF